MLQLIMIVWIRVGYSQEYGDIMSHEILGANTKCYRKFMFFCRILSFTGSILLLESKSLLATGIVSQWQESYILWNKMCIYANRHPSCDRKFLPVAVSFFLAKEMPSYTLIFLPMISNFVLWQENSSYDINFFLWQ